MLDKLRLDLKTHKWLADHVSHRGEECLTWPYSRNRGYGNFQFEGRQHYVHRVMCELAHGPAPSPKHEAAHSCGNGAKACANPRHLSWKTRAENQADRHRHGTLSKGKPSHLTAEQVLEIRASMDSAADLARRYGVTRSAIIKVRSGEIWKEIHRTPERAKVIATLQAASAPVHYSRLPADPGVISKMVTRGQIVRVSRGLYALPPQSFGHSR